MTREKQELESSSSTAREKIKKQKKMKMKRKDNDERKGSCKMWGHLKSKKGSFKRSIWIELMMLKLKIEN